MAAGPILSVSQAFDGKVLLLTGGSGFVGKGLLEKLLRTCPGIRKVYVLLRAGKAGTLPEERLRAMLKEPLFDGLRAAGYGDRLERVSAVAGDCASTGLGLADEDRARLQDDVQVFIHTAASVRFDDPLKRAVLLNTRGAREAAALASGMRRLEVMVHVSTTYCNTHANVIEERVYPMPAETREDWREIISLAETLDEEALESRVARGYQPNTYTFSKALAEQIMKDHSDRFNIAVFRPAIVVGAIKEPMPGWTNNLNGPFALCIGITKGLVHTALADKDAVIDMVPLEMVVNGIILAAREGIVRLVRTYWKIYRATVSLRYFSLTHWVFENDKFYALLGSLGAEDASTFKLDMSDVDEMEYVHTHLQYLRRHILKENMDPKAARRNQTAMFVLDRCTRVVLLYFAVTWAYRLFCALFLRSNIL
ncbi:hypothetical protein FOCC_FOCC001420 [Frankliniella occidentalis]|nr:hypothetical protein FOCC_FOCC001420 [Frankliniella occidentalis]